MTHTVHDVAAAVLEQVGPMDAMKLQKLVYYCQAWHLAATDEPLYRDTIQAWTQGPVVLSLWEEHRSQRLVSSWKGNPQRLDDDASAVVSLVCQVYGPLSGDDLSEMTHEEKPWRQAREGLADNAKSRSAIKLPVMKDFYRRRQLGGRTVDDLVAGGLAGLTDTSLSPSERRARLAELRDSFRGAPAAHPAGRTWVRSYTPGAKLPDRSQVTVSRERPTRERPPF